MLKIEMTDQGWSFSGPVIYRVLMLAVVIGTLSHELSIVAGSTM